MQPGGFRTYSVQRGLESGSLSGFPTSNDRTPLYPPFIPSAEIIRGVRLNGRMSAVRRFFCLFVTFDFLLACLLWLLTVMVEGHFDWYDVLLKQLIHYKISSSLIDIVIAAGCRFFILNLFYGCIQIQHWFVVAMTTAGSGAFIVTKIMLFDWSDTSNHVLKIMQLLSSFILSWAEAWLLDIKVVPLENYCEALQAGQVTDDRTRLINDFLCRPRDFDREATIGSNDCFQTPIESDDEDGSPFENVPKRATSDSVEYVAKGIETLSTAWSIVNWDQWSDEKKIHGCKIVNSKWNGQKIFKLSCVLKITTSKLFNVLFHDVEDLPLWNDNVSSSHIVEKIDQCTDITCQISKGVSVISSKEYVLLRHYKEKGDYRVISTISINWPLMGSSLSRGSMGPSCWAIKPLSSKESEVIWLLNTKVPGVPFWVLDRTIPGVMAQTIMDLLKHCNSSQTN